MNKTDISHFNLEITRKCNQKCFYCFNDSGYSKRSEEISLLEWKDSISEIHNLGYKSVHITGGEPFLHPDIVEILSHSIELGLETTILSNGLKIATLVKKHPELFSKLKLAQISLDSMDAEMHNSRRGFRDAYVDAMTAVKTLIGVGVPIEISTTVSQQNINHIVEIGKFCKSINASLILRPLILTGRANNILHEDGFFGLLQDTIEILKTKFQIDVIEDRFNYVADDEMSDKYFKENGTITVEATGKIRGVYFLNSNLKDLLQALKVA
jgi:MoaA/NifB/PqqE/SkfB family radical SAM enzyme